MDDALGRYKSLEDAHAALQQTVSVRWRRMRCFDDDRCVCFPMISDGYAGSRRAYSFSHATSVTVRWLVRAIAWAGVYVPSLSTNELLCFCVHSCLLWYVAAIGSCSWEWIVVSTVARAAAHRWLQSWWASPAGKLLLVAVMRSLQILPQKVDPMRLLSYSTLLWNLYFRKNAPKRCIESA